MNSIYFLLLLPVAMLFCLWALSVYIKKLNKRDLRLSVKNRIVGSRKRCDKMRGLIERASQTNGTTQNGIDGASRLIKGAEGSIQDAETAIADDPQEDQRWRSAADSLKIAGELLDKVPAAIADAPGGTS